MRPGYPPEGRKEEDRTMKTKGLFALLVVALVLTALGCASNKGVAPRRVDPGQASLGEGTGIGSQDLGEVTDKMARSILSTPEIANAPTPPVIALLPVTNDTRFAINKDLFNKRIKALLNTQCQGKVKFIARDRIEAVERERELKREGQVTSGAEGDLAGADYFLTGELTGLSQAASTGRSDYVLYTFRLIDAETSIEVWENFSEIKKEGLEDAAYR